MCAFVFSLCVHYFILVFEILNSENKRHANVKTKKQKQNQKQFPNHCVCADEYLSN